MEIEGVGGKNNWEIKLTLFGSQLHKKVEDKEELRFMQKGRVSLLLNYLIVSDHEEYRVWDSY